MSRRGAARRGPSAPIAAALLVAIAALALWLANRPEPRPRSGETNANGAESYRLDRDEAAGGHTLSRHVGQSDGELRSRLRRERSISASSTFSDRATAEAAVAAGLAQRAEQVSRWRSGGSRGDLALDYRGERGRWLGRVLRRGDPTPRPASDARIVLRARGDGYYVLTAYPLEEQR